MTYRQLPPESEMPRFFGEWLNWLSLHDKSPSTIRAYSQGVRRVISFAEFPPSEFAEFGPNTWNQASLTDTVREMSAAGEISASTLNQSLAALKSFFHYCRADYLVDTVPDVYRIPQMSRLVVARQEPECYHLDQVRHLFKAATESDYEQGLRVHWPARDLAMCGFLAVLGLRASELFGADLDWISPGYQVDWHDRPFGLTRVNESLGDYLDWVPRERHVDWVDVIQVVGKGLRTRHLPMTPELVAANELWQFERAERFGGARTGDPLFVTNGGERFTYGQLRYWLRGLNRLAGLRDYSLKALRLTARDQLEDAGVSRRKVGRLLGMDRPDHL